MTNLYDTLVPIPWYRRERYDEARARMADGDTMPGSFDEWVDRAEQREKQARREGKTPCRVYVDDDDFAVFCSGRDQVLDRRARQDFVALRVAQTFKATLADHENPTFRHGPGPRRKR